ncbi:MAG TPA: hypothetical protein VNV66_05515, partial [Pilimelia sp.]|nr:hypothetical protein [Pilimelia sp.]
NRRRQPATGLPGDYPDRTHTGRRRRASDHVMAAGQPPPDRWALESSRLGALRNLAVNALRLAGRRDITEATRWASRNMTRPFTILDITS